MSYTERLIVTIQPNLIDIGRSITRALDPDLGGAESWTAVRNTGDETSEPDCYIADTPCTLEFKEKALYLLNNPESLFQAVSADYASRWVELVPPTLEECEMFCANAQVDEGE